MGPAKPPASSALLGTPNHKDATRSTGSNGGSKSWFTVRRDKGTWWLVRHGKPFWSFGVDCVEPGVDPAKEDPKNPGYSGLELFPDEKGWATNAVSQLRSWGFNTLGAWSDAEGFQKLNETQRMPYAVCLHLGAYDQAPWHDLFSLHMQKAMDGAAAAQIPKYRSDPYLIGYFSDNELGWWDDTLFLSYLHMGAHTPGHAVLVDLLRGTYHDMSALKKEWITSARSFEEIRDLKLRPGGHGRRVVKAWAATCAEQYYKLAHDIIRKYDPNHLILGDRYCQYYSLPVVKASIPYVDVVSTNLGADWNDGSLSPFYLDTLHSVTGKPVLVSEFYFAATENRSGDRNSSDGFPVVRTQQERALAFGRYVRQVAYLRYMVGAHWFQYYDEPGNGRGDGENYNMGLVDIQGRPYEELTREAAGLNPEEIHDTWFGADVSGSREPSTGPQNPFDGLKSWKRQSARVRPTSPDPIADLYAFGTDHGLYVGLYAMDYADKSLYESNAIPEVDRCRFQIWPREEKAPPITVRFGGGRPAVVSGYPGCKVQVKGGLKSTMILFIPAQAFSERDGYQLDAAFETHGRAERVIWTTGVPRTDGK